MLIGKNDLATIYPNIAKLYSVNNEKPASEILYTNQSSYNWICDKCNGSFNATIQEVNEGHCPYCENKRVLSGKNDFKTMYPHLVKMYSKDNILAPDKTIYTSSFYYKWHCDDCNGDFTSSIDKLDKDGCPYCNGRKALKGYNDLTVTHPHLIKEWGLENYLIDVGGPENYKFDSVKNVYWLCPKCGTHYRMNIDDRVISDKRHHESCWKCSGRMKNILKL